MCFSIMPSLTRYDAKIPRQLLFDLLIGLATFKVCVPDWVYLLIRRVHQNFNFSIFLPFWMAYLLLDVLLMAFTLSEFKGI